jgi:hypothetical protein
MMAGLLVEKGVTGKPEGSGRLNAFSRHRAAMVNRN